MTNVISQIGTLIEKILSVASTKIKKSKSLIIDVLIL